MVSDAELIELQRTLYTSANPTLRWLHCTRRDWISAAVRRWAPPIRRQALEVGPGSGVYLPLVAEFAGQYGLQLEQWLERRLRGGPAQGLLWTQCYVARAQVQTDTPPAK